MKILLLTVLYKNLIEDLYARNPSLGLQPYNVQKIFFNTKIPNWASDWEEALLKKGVEVFTIPINVLPLQKKWGNEHGLTSPDTHSIAFEQVKQFQPDVLWYDYFSIPLVKKIKAEIPSIALVLGWTGSAIVNLDVLKESDLVLTCAPETVERLIFQGIKAEHLNHAFNPAVLNTPELKSVNKNHDLSFIGQIFRGTEYHRRREILLKKIVRRYDLRIFSPIHHYGVRKVLLSLSKKMGYYLTAPFSKSDTARDLLRNNAYLNELLKSKNQPVLPYDRDLKKKASPAVYGIEMYKKIMESKVVLNIHADSSQQYASNMRLFETTGVGTCLLTDWKENLSQLFADGSEIVSYKSDEECLEKIAWLLQNPQRCIEIGEAGKQRTLKDHTYNRRAIELMDIVDRNLK